MNTLAFEAVRCVRLVDRAHDGVSVFDCGHGPPVIPERQFRLRRTPPPPRPSSPPATERRGGHRARAAPLGCCRLLVAPWRGEGSAAAREAGGGRPECPRPR